MDVKAAELNLGMIGQRIQVSTASIRAEGKLHSVEFSESWGRNQAPVVKLNIVLDGGGSAYPTLEGKEIVVLLDDADISGGAG